MAVDHGRIIGKVDFLLCMVFVKILTITYMNYGLKLSGTTGNIIITLLVIH